MAEAKKIDDVDLFGQPTDLVRDRWGRPSFKKNEENQQFVSLLVAMDYSQDEIAEAIGCDAKTLRKYFSRELEGGRKRIKIEMLQVLYRNARNGNNAAAGRLLTMMQEEPRVPSKPSRQAAEPKAKNLGKKEQLLQDLEKTPDDWAGVLPH
ncbi:MAG: hypothetical protein AAFR27_03250 [Pseudomonadota bacterium]